MEFHGIQLFCVGRTEDLVWNTLGKQHLVAVFAGTRAKVLPTFRQRVIWDHYILMVCACWSGFHEIPKIVESQKGIVARLWPIPEIRSFNRRIWAELGRVIRFSRVGMSRKVGRLQSDGGASIFAAKKEGFA